MLVISTAKLTPMDCELKTFEKKVASVFYTFITSTDVSWGVKESVMEFVTS